MHGNPEIVCRAVGQDIGGHESTGTDIMGIMGHVYDSQTECVCPARRFTVKEPDTYLKFTSASSI